MKLASRISMLIFMLSVTACAIGQDLTVFRMLGNIVPHSPAVIEKNGSSILIYKRRGVLFHVSRQADVILNVVVFPPAKPALTSTYSGGMGDVVPGVGAYGATLGASMEQVRLSPCLKDATVMTEDGKGAVYDLGRPRMLIVSIRDSKVSQLDVHGPFKTSDGITERCSAPQIQAVYGPPDEYCDIEWGVSPHPWSGAVLILPLLGLATGLVLRWVRPRVAGTPGGVAFMVAFGAIGLSIATAAYLVVLLVPTGAGVPPLWYRALSGVLMGGGSALVLELVPRRLPRLFGYICTLVVMLVVALVVDQVVELMHPLPIGPPALARLMMLNGPFIVAMFFAAGVSRAE